MESQKEKKDEKETEDELGFTPYEVQELEHVTLDLIRS